MQFKPPEYEELFSDVIVPVCDKMGLEPFRSSQTYYPGLVIADIQRQIRESRVVIAEITPVNPNVYYEVGYADAIGKPVILIADGGKLEQLPFDVRAFRTLFYENTIGGKNRVEKTLLEFLKNIMSQNTWAM
jgi:nucleoside 2-deoxyribosyltransferase